MTALEQSILVDWEQNNTPLEVIAEFQDLEPEVIKAVLLRHSKKYRDQLTGDSKEGGAAKTKEEIAENLRQEEINELEGAYKQLALYTDNEHIKERALRHLINDRKGRLDKKVGPGTSVVKNTKINVMVLNDTIKRSRQGKILKQIGDLSKGVLELEPVND